MIGESQLNVYVIGKDLSDRLRERLQAQIHGALRTLPPWAFALLHRRLQRLGLPNFALIVEPQPRRQAKALSFGSLGERPAVHLLPVVKGEEVDWQQDRRYLVAKAVAYLSAPGRDDDPAFWERWQAAAEADAVGQKARQADERWDRATLMDLFVEMFAAYALKPGHERWADLPAVRNFLQEWQATAFAGRGPR